LAYQLSCSVPLARQPTQDKENVMRKHLISVAAGAVLIVGLAGIAGPAQATPVAAHVPTCKGALLHVGHSRTQGATGHGSVVLRFRNISQSTCKMRGYPGVDALGRGGRVLKHAKRTLNGFAGGADAVRTIVLQSFRVDSALVEWHNFNFRTGGTCRFSAKIAVTPPNTFRTTRFPVSVSLCALQVHPVVHGRTGTG
jgi:hypothetical protein